jgi:hypothetical protein
MWDLVIDHRGAGEFALRLAHDAERMQDEVLCSDFLPLAP